MIRRIVAIVLFLLSCGSYGTALATERIHPHGIDICSVIINEMTEGKIARNRAKEIALAIGHAGNKHFGRVTCGDMWLYMAIVYVESGFRSNIINHEQCLGMFQIHGPSWARKFGLTYKDLLNIQINADCGLRVFKYYLEQYRRVVPALSAYNSDHPQAAVGYALAVLGTRKKIKKRYTEIYRAVKDGKVAALSPGH